jgi:hypothetical protein
MILVSFDSWWLFRFLLENVAMQMQGAQDEFKEWKRKGAVIPFSKKRGA